MKLNDSQQTLICTSFPPEKLTSAGGDKTKERVPSDDPHSAESVNNNNSSIEVCGAPMFFKHYRFYKLAKKAPRMP